MSTFRLVKSVIGLTAYGGTTNLIKYDIMKEKVKLMVYYQVGKSHPYDYRTYTDEDVFKILTTKESIVEIYLAQSERETGLLGRLPTLLDYVDDFNSQEMDNGQGMWLAYLKVSRELVENYLKK